MTHINSSFWLAGVGLAAAATGRSGARAPAPAASRDAEAIGPFQHLVIQAVNALTDRAHPAEIARWIARRQGGDPQLAQVFKALERLEGRGLVSSTTSSPEPVRGGRRRKIFQLEEPGVRALNKGVATTTKKVRASSRRKGPLNEPATAPA